VKAKTSRRFVDFGHFLKKTSKVAKNLEVFKKVEKIQQKLNKRRILSFFANFSMYHNALRF
jgi:hypothetical protein